MAYNASLAVSKNLELNTIHYLFMVELDLEKLTFYKLLEIMQLKKGSTVIYVTIEQFMNDFTFSIKNKKYGTF